MEAALIRKVAGTVVPVRVFPDPVLKEVCSPVRDIDEAALKIVEDLVETMLALPRCVGLAAPQIGVLSRIVVVDVSRQAKAPPRNHGLLCMINPVIILSAGLTVSREGCVSVPEFTANVARAEHVAINYLDCDGNSKAIEAKGFEAIALQHELDHLEGKLFLDRVAAEDVFRRKRKAS